MALRSMKAPGTAYDDPVLGRDPQPADMSGYQRLPETDEGDNGGVHINSGIPNHAFYLVATSIGGHAWEAPGHIWYEALLASSPDAQFQNFAETTYTKAGQLYGEETQKAVRSAWAEVGVMINGRLGAAAPAAAAAPVGATVPAAAARPEETLAILQRSVETLSREVEALKQQRARTPELSH
jgi:hypothetical protein